MNTSTKEEFEKWFAHQTQHSEVYVDPSLARLAWRAAQASQPAPVVPGGLELAKMVATWGRECHPENLQKLDAALFVNKALEIIAELEAQLAQGEVPLGTLSVLEGLDGPQWMFRASNPRLLPIGHTPLFTRPAPDADVMRDALRYRALRQEAERDYVEFRDKWFESAVDFDNATDALAKGDA